MATKAEITSMFIIEKVAPIFNKLGYEATSMSDITKATGLTKGAIYGNFKNKEHLAIEVFNYNIRKVLWKMADEINIEETASAKLQAMTNFYRKYYNHVIDFGGCPLMNVGVDTNNMNPVFHTRVVTILKKLQINIGTIIQQGIDTEEFKSNLDAKQLGARIISHIHGAIFTSVMLKDPIHITDMMGFLDTMIEKELKN